MNIMNYKASNLIHIANVKYEEHIVLEEITFVPNLFLYLVWWLEEFINIFCSLTKSITYGICQLKTRVGHIILLRVFFTRKDQVKTSGKCYFCYSVTSWSHMVFVLGLAKAPGKRFLFQSRPHQTRIFSSLEFSEIFRTGIAYNTSKCYYLEIQLVRFDVQRKPSDWFLFEMQLWDYANRMYFWRQCNLKLLILRTKLLASFNVLYNFIQWNVQMDGWDVLVTATKHSPILWRGLMQQITVTCWSLHWFLLNQLMMGVTSEVRNNPNFLSNRIDLPLVLNNLFYGIKLFYLRKPSQCMFIKKAFRCENLTKR